MTKYSSSVRENFQFTSLNHKFNCIMVEQQHYWKFSFVIYITSR